MKKYKKFDDIDFNFATEEDFRSYMHWVRKRYIIIALVPAGILVIRTIVRILFC